MKPSILWKLISVLWGIWGAFHLAVGVFLLLLLSRGETAEALNGIAGQVELASLQGDYSPAVVGTLKQHSFNLGWFGLVTLLGSLFVWRRDAWAVLLCGLVGGFGDLGYFLFIDLADLATPPGPQMTWISGGAIALSVYLYFKTEGLRAPTTSQPN